MKWLPHFELEAAELELPVVSPLAVSQLDSGQVLDALARVDEVYQAPADFILPAPLKQVVLVGCAVENWRDVKVSMICFHAGKAPSRTASDLWLFVVDADAVRNAPPEKEFQLDPVNQLMTASWRQEGKLYLLGTKGDELAIKKFL